MKSVLILLLGLLFPCALFSQGNSTNNRVTNSTDLTVIVDPILQSYEWIVNLPSAKVDKDQYRLGFGDVITIITKGTYPIVLKSHVITSSEEIYIPKVGFVSVRGKSISEAEKEFQRVLSEQYGDVRAEISLELPKQVNTTIHFPDGKLVEASYSALQSINELIMQSIKTMSSLPEDELKSIRPQTPADNPLLKSAMVKTTFSDKNTELQLTEDIPTYTVLDFRNYTFDIRKVYVRYAESEPVELDLFEEWILDDFSLQKQVNESAHIYLQPLKTPANVFSISGDVRKSFIVPVNEKDDIGRWIKEVVISSDGEWTLSTEQGEKSYSHLNGLLEAFDQIKVQDESFIKVHYSQNVQSYASEKEGFWHFDSEQNQFEFIHSKSLSSFLKDTDLSSNSHVFVRNTDWMNKRDRLERLMLEGNNPLMEDQLDYLQYLRENDAIIPINSSIINEEFSVPDGYILVSFPKSNTVKLLGQFVQPGQFQFMSSDLDTYLNLAGGLTSAATGTVYVIKSGSFNWVEASIATIEAGDILYAERIPMDNFQAYRTFEIQEENLKIQEENLKIQEESLKRDRIRTYISAVGTLLSVLTTIIVISRN